MNREQEKKELFKTIWNIADDLRNAVDGWDFKSYVLGTLFYRFISENLTDYINNSEKEVDSTFDYATLTDEQAESGRTDTIEEKGFFILPSQLFCNVQKRAKEDDDLNETVFNIFKSIEKTAEGYPSEANVKGLFSDFDVNSNKLGGTTPARNATLVKLFDAIAGLKLGNYKDNSIDVFGDAYEYLMGMYASQAGKSGGEYFTPQEVSELLAKIAIDGKSEVNKVYDPCCGSGSLLLKFKKVLGNKNIRQGFYGQEKNPTTYNLCRINMFLHDVNYNHFDIKLGDTLLDPKHWDDEPFDAIVSNPPYSTKWDGDSNPLLINDPRFSPAAILAPKSKADLAFTMHMLHWLSNKGTCAIVEFPGVLYRGGAEQKIRKYLVENNYIDCIIQLPADLFFGVTIATCIIVLKKSKLDNKVTFIDASNEFVREGTKNKLTSFEGGNIDKIVEFYKSRENKEHFCSLATFEQIESNDFNLSVNKYVEKKSEKLIINIAELNAEIEKIVERQSKLRTSLDSIVLELEGDGE